MNTVTKRNVSLNFIRRSVQGDKENGCDVIFKVL